MVGSDGTNLSKSEWLKFQTSNRKWFGIRAMAQKLYHFRTGVLLTIRIPNTFGIQIVTVQQLLFLTSKCMLCMHFKSKMAKKLFWCFSIWSLCELNFFYMEHRKTFKNELFLWGSRRISCIRWSSLFNSSRAHIGLATPKTAILPFLT
jgi:hypothetical protein